jgi:hypothetical protein
LARSLVSAAVVRLPGQSVPRTEGSCPPQQSVTVRVALREPVVLGVNVTSMVQLLLMSASGR